MQYYAQGGAGRPQLEFPVYWYAARLDRRPMNGSLAQHRKQPSCARAARRECYAFPRCANKPDARLIAFEELRARTGGADWRASGEVPLDRVALSQDLQRIAGVNDPEEFPDTGDRDRFAGFRTELRQYLEEARPALAAGSGSSRRTSGTPTRVESRYEFPFLESVVRRLVALAQTPA